MATQAVQQSAGENYIQDALTEVRDELLQAVVRFRAFNSPHEGYAVILEELDELKDEVWENESRAKMRAEACQVAAMAVRFMIDLCRGGK